MKPHNHELIVASLFLYLSHFKDCCWLRSVFITTKYIILILLCKLLFEITKPWLILNVLVVVKLLPTLKHVINVNSQKSLINMNVPD